MSVVTPQNRGFHASVAVRGRSSEDPGAADDPSKEGSAGAPNKNSNSAKENATNSTTSGKETPDTSANPPAETPAQPPVEVNNKRERLRSQGYGSARARATRNLRVDETVAVQLPKWFMDDCVSLYEQRPIGSPNTLLLPLLEQDREDVAAVLDARIEEAALTEDDVAAAKEKLLRAAQRGVAAVAPVAEQLVGRARDVHNAAFFQALAMVHTDSADPEHLDRLRQHYAERAGEMERLAWWPDEKLSLDAQRWLANLRSEAVPGSGSLHGSPLAKRPSVEYPVCMELLAAIRTQLETPPPISQHPNSRRPVNILAVLNRKGRTVPQSVINDIATDLNADVVHLDAHILADLIGRHLGQNPYAARGSLTMLGYGAAELNGRLAPRPDPDAELNLGMVSVTLPPRLRSFRSLYKDSYSAGASSEGRWDDLKMGTALETLISAAEIKRGLMRAQEEERPKFSVPAQNLIVHVHDFAELSSLHPSLITKLRTIVDRMWLGGRRVVLVGSSSGDQNSPSRWRDQLADLGQDGDHIIPFQADESSQWTELYDNVRDNLANVEAMLRGMLGFNADINLGKVRIEDGPALVDSKEGSVGKVFSSHLYDAQWIYRLASLMVGCRAPRYDKFRLSNLEYALQYMSDQNKHWSSICPSVHPPYFSPLLTPRKNRGEGVEWDFSLSSGGGGGGDGRGGSGSGGFGGTSSSKEYDQHEKKLLSGLINAKDLHTTFDDIVVPQETKDSLIGLTSLSLIRPEAFSYGILKTERVPGCLLYGPPGTGKTLLAKAVAKESGANMLEVSAASINDMWLGQSEKNVRALFSLARKLSPCVIFLDEADALLGARQNTPGRSGHRETITQFLREWDGLSGPSNPDQRAFIMVATNRPFDLDEAVLRRLPRKILVDLPLRAEREKILRVMLRDEVLDSDVDIAYLAGEPTELYSGSDLKNLCVSAAMEAVREEVRLRDAHTGDEPFVWPEKRVLKKKHFEKALREISASISEDMESLKAIRKFDEQYGDAGRKRRAKRGIGFEVVSGKVGSGEARVRQVAEDGGEEKGVAVGVKVDESAAV